MRHSGGASPLARLHLVSAWATEANLTLGQVAVEEKSNEITAIPLLLELLDLKGGRSVPWSTRAKCSATAPSRTPPMHSTRPSDEPLAVAAAAEFP